MPHKALGFGSPEPFPLLFTHISKENGHTKLVLILDPRYKSMHLVRTYAGCDNVVVLVVEYDWKLLFPLLMEVYKLSMPIIIKEFDEFRSRTKNEDFFYTIQTTANILKDLVGREFYIYYWYHVDGDSYNCALTW